MLQFEALQGAEAFARMQSHTNRIDAIQARGRGVVGSAPSAIMNTVDGVYGQCRSPVPGAGFASTVGSATLAKGEALHAVRASALMFRLNDAGARAGVFFGRLKRWFDELPSHRFSGPSAEFISVNGVWTRHCDPRFAPMNNPYRRSSAFGVRRGDRVSSTLVLSHFV